MDTALAQLVRVASTHDAVAVRRSAASHRRDVDGAGVAVAIEARDARPASLTLVRRAVRAGGGTPAGTVSGGIAEMGADVWAAAGFDGRGIKVGIIDAGFKGRRAELGSELLAQVVIWGQNPSGPEGGASDDQEHGAAVAEVVHDAAPGAQPHLARVDDVVTLGLAEQWRVAQGVQVISHSMGWWGHGQLNGAGLVNGVVDDAVSHGVLWVPAEGNGRRGRWMGTSVTRMRIPPSTGTGSRATGATRSARRRGRRSAATCGGTNPGRPRPRTTTSTWRSGTRRRARGSGSTTPATAGAASRASIPRSGSAPRRPSLVSTRGR